MTGLSILDCVVIQSLVSELNLLSLCFGINLFRRPWL